MGFACHVGCVAGNLIAGRKSDEFHGHFCACSCGMVRAEVLVPSAFRLLSVRCFAVVRHEEVLILEQEVRHHSLTLFFILLARLLQSVASLGEVGRMACSPLMPAISVALQWMAVSPDYVRYIPGLCFGAMLSLFVTHWH